MSDAQRLVALYVDLTRAEGLNGMELMKGHMALRIKELLETEACTTELAEAAIREFVRRRSTSPMALAEIACQVWFEQNGEASKRPSARKRAQEWITMHGWPTGVKLVRGTHGVQEVPDTLGCERAPFDWPYPKPTFDEIAEAVAQLPEGAERKPTVSRREAPTVERKNWWGDEGPDPEAERIFREMASHVGGWDENWIPVDHED